MTTKPVDPAARKKLLSRITAAQRQADVAKKTAKLAKLGLRAAKDKFKSAKRAAKKLRKAVKALKAGLAALGTAKPSRKRPTRKSAAKHPRPTPVATPAPIETVSLPPEVPPVAPV